MKIPATISPMLAVSSTPFDSPDYLYEIKWDGLRCISFIEDAMRLQSRNLKDITFQYPELSSITQKLQKNTVLDGEIVVLENDKPSFSKLQSRMHATSKQGIKKGIETNPVIYVVFDILFYKTKSLLDTPLIKRKDILYNEVLQNEHLIISEAIPEKGIDLFNTITNLGLEGIVAKEFNSVYQTGKRSNFWKKTRVTKSSEFLICGYTKNPKGRTDLSALVIGTYQNEKLVSYGLVGTGFSQSEIDYLLGLLKPLETSKSPFSHPLEPAIRNAQWVHPELICEVEYLEITSDRHLRHPLYRGLRQDLDKKAINEPKSSITR